MQFSAEYQPRHEERVEVYERIFGFQDGRAPRYLYSSLAAAFPAGFVFVVASDLDPISVRVLIGLVIVAVLTVYWMLAWRRGIRGMSHALAARSRVASSRTLKTLTIDAEGVESSTFSIRLRIPWAELDQVSDLGWGFFFVSTHVGGVAVPRRVFDSDESYRAAVDGAILLAREAGRDDAIKTHTDCKACGHWQELCGSACVECGRTG